MASTTCAAVTIDRAERNQPVPRIPSVLGVAFLSSSLNSLVMLTVERTSVEGSMHDASIPVDVALRTKIENKHRRIALSPDCASHMLGSTKKTGPTGQQDYRRREAETVINGHQAARILPRKF